MAIARGGQVTHGGGRPHCRARWVFGRIDAVTRCVRSKSPLRPRTVAGSSIRELLRRSRRTGAGRHRARRRCSATCARCTDGGTTPRSAMSARVGRHPLAGHRRRRPSTVSGALPRPRVARLVKRTAREPDRRCGGRSLCSTVRWDRSARSAPAPSRTGEREHARRRRQGARPPSQPLGDRVADLGRTGATSQAAAARGPTAVGAGLRV